MITEFTLKDQEVWDKIVRSFKNYDVYYLSGYVKPFQIIEDGDPTLLFFEIKNLKGILVGMKRAIPFTNLYDFITPYGYGGWIFEGEISNDNLKIFKNEYFSFMKSHLIIDNFTRYHPVISNVQHIKNILNVEEVGKTITIDLSNPEIILSNMSSTCRNRVRKAEKNGIIIKHSNDRHLIEKFIPIYNQTMDRDNAKKYYYFPKEYYESTWLELQNNLQYFYAIYEGKIISIALILYANDKMHYHLGGTITEYRNLAAVNRIFYEAALWGHNKGFTTFHLGGGLGGIKDELYRFKSNFNKNSNNYFFIGKDIFIKKEYEKLVDLRKKEDPNFNINSNFFPLYRN